MGFWGLGCGVLGCFFVARAFCMSSFAVFTEVLCSSNQVWRSLLEFRSGRLRVVRGFFDSRVHRY